jgi:BON domain
MRNRLGVGVAGTAGLGAGLMFLLDPDMGSRRRAILRDKLISFIRLAAGAADKTSRDLKNRVYGTVASTKSRFSDIDVFDDILVERVRSQMGRAVSHPHAIQVTAKNGEVRLSGEILAEEADDLIRRISTLKGIKNVKNQLTSHDQPGDISSLQGGHTRRGSQYALLQSNWPPAVRFIVGTSGAIAAGIGIRQRGIVGSTIAAVGTAVAIIAITNQSLRQIVNRAVRQTEKQVSKGEGRARTIEFPGRQRKTG